MRSEELLCCKGPQVLVPLVPKRSFDAMTFTLVPYEYDFWRTSLLQHAVLRHDERNNQREIEPHARLAGPHASNFLEKIFK